MQGSEKASCRAAGVNSVRTRHIIDRDTPVNGGVFYWEGAKEAVLVDSKKYSKLMGLYETCRAHVASHGVIQKAFVLNAVYDVVCMAMPRRSEAAVRRIIREYGVKKESHIALDIFLIEGAGLNRHYALACAALLELFKDDGILRGCPSLDYKPADSGNHVWCRYTSSRGEVYILDAARKYFGKLNSAPDETKWLYKRPDD